MLARSGEVRVSDLHRVHTGDVIVGEVGEVVTGPPSMGKGVRDGRDEWNLMARFTHGRVALESDRVAMEVASLEHLNDAFVVAAAHEHDRLDLAVLEQLVVSLIVVHPGAFPLLLRSQEGPRSRISENVGLDDK